jgi:hypothetical protein
MNSEREVAEHARWTDRADFQNHGTELGEERCRQLTAMSGVDCGSSTGYIPVNAHVAGRGLSSREIRRGTISRHPMSLIRLFVIFSLILLDVNRQAVAVMFRLPPRSSRRKKLFMRTEL